MRLNAQPRIGGEDRIRSEVANLAEEVGAHIEAAPVSSVWIVEVRQLLNADDLRRRALVAQ